MGYNVADTSTQIKDVILAKKVEDTSRGTRYFLAYKSDCVREAHFENLKQASCYGYRSESFDEETGEDTIVYTLVSYEMYQFLNRGDNVIFTNSYRSEIKKE